MNSRSKGKRGEREVAKLLQDWWRKLEPECKFATTPSSGGWSTPEMRGEFKVAGDLTTTAKRWPWTVEVKRREGWSDKTLKEGKASPIWGWWKQVLKSSAEEKRMPMLWFRRSHEPWLVMFAESDVWWQPASAKFSWGSHDLNFEKHPIVFAAVDILRVDPSSFLAGFERGALIG